MSRFQVPANAGEERRKEKVTLTWGDVWVWEMTTAEYLRVLERAKRPSFDPRGGIDTGEQIVTQILCQCYHGDQPGSEPVFTEATLLDIYKLPGSDFQKLVDALAKVNGTSAEEAKGLDDFFAPTAVSSNSG